MGDNTRMAGIKQRLNKKMKNCLDFLKSITLVPEIRTKICFLFLTEDSVLSEICVFLQRMFQ